MSVVWTLKKLLFGETWLQPFGLAIAFVVTLVARHLLGEQWHDVGGFILLACVIAVLAVSVGRSAKPR